MIRLRPLNRPGVALAQSVVTAHHYLRKPVDARCSVDGYAVEIEGAAAPIGYLLLGRPQATKVRGWYGTVQDLAAGRVACTYWQILNLARVWFDPQVQQGGRLHGPDFLPGFTDRRGRWRSTLASEALRLAAERVRVDYLVRRPPCFLEEPYQLAWLLSYCDRRLHRGVIYRAAGFELYRPHEPERGRWVETWRKPLPALNAAQDAHVRVAAAISPRSIAYREARRGQAIEQLEIQAVSA